MRYCFNPTCKEPQNLDSTERCQACGSSLRLQNRYGAIALLGQGGFGRTFLAIDEEGEGAGEAEGAEGKDSLRIQRTASVLCVVKQFLPLQTGTTAAAIALFHKEAQRLQELGVHPQIPTLLAFFEEEQQLYLVQEFIDGQNLEQLLTEDGAFTEAAIWQLLDQILPILKFIHARQMIHRDIKPANLIKQRLGAASRLVLVDFGAAKLVQPDDRLKTGTSIGSAEYVAPEQACGKAVFASDLYSLGITCIHLLTNLSPFDLFDFANDDWAWRQYTVSPVSDRLAAILDRLLQNALSKRFQSADDVMRAIQASETKRQDPGEQGNGDPLPLTTNHPLATLSTQNSKPSTQNSHPVSPWRCVHTFTGHTASVNALALSPNRDLLVSSSDDKTTRCWDLRTGSVTAAVLDHVQAVRAIAVSPDGESIASGGKDRAVVLTQKWYFDGSGHSERLGQHAHAVTAIAFASDGQMLASASRDKTIKLWNLAAKAEICTLTEHRLNVTAIAFSPDGRFLASASADHTACLWTTAANLNLHRRFTDHVGTVQAVAFSPDGEQLATGGDDRTIKLWSTHTGRLLRTLPGHSWTVSALKFTPDGTTLISSSWDGTLKLWDLTSAQSDTAIVLTGHSDSINAIALSADGQTLASGSSDKTIRVWQLAEGRDRSITIK